jgi:hypothetical protein
VYLLLSFKNNNVSKDESERELRAGELINVVNENNLSTGLEEHKDVL